MINTRSIMCFQLYFQNSYAKVYNKKDEEILRMSIFLENFKFIHDHNKRYANEEESYSVQVNKFADLVRMVHKF